MNRRVRLPASRLETAFPELVSMALLCNLALAAMVGPALAAGSGRLKIVALGDSLTAGYMLKPDQSFPAQLAAALEAKGHDVEIVNAGVSGDTTQQGLERLDWSVPEDAHGVIVELGANDALRGLPPEVARANLEKIVAGLKARNLPVLIAGMAAPANWGRDYSDSFNAIYRELAEKHGLILYPFFLEGIALKPQLNLDDGLHPNPAGVAEIVRRILPSVEALLEKAEAYRTASKS